ncbi:microtubule-associated protein futsch-like isoform X2 [Bolinopsis microptera]|uniref:microtubule-associated protein futsch-like isoform X2 n=1 Tax=Bolinopsis microptera TaxID=2820187 RepID=UPI00307B0CA3
MTEHTIRIIKRGGADGTKYPVNQKEITFGTESTCDIRVKIPTVDKVHTRLEFEHKQVKLYNLSVKNPTRVNGSPIAGECLLRHGDVFTIIDRSFRYESTLEGQLIAEAEKENVEVTPPPKPRKSKIMFGPELTPEEFDKKLPVIKPISKGRTPPRRGSTGFSILKGTGKTKTAGILFEADESPDKLTVVAEMPVTPVKANNDDSDTVPVMNLNENVREERKIETVEEDKEDIPSSEPQEPEVEQTELSEEECDLEKTQKIPSNDYRNSSEPTNLNKSMSEEPDTTPRLSQGSSAASSDNIVIYDSESGEPDTNSRLSQGSSAASSDNIVIYDSESGEPDTNPRLSQGSSAASSDNIVIYDSESGEPDTNPRLSQGSSAASSEDNITIYDTESEASNTNKTDKADSAIKPELNNTINDFLANKTTDSAPIEDNLDETQKSEIIQLETSNRVSEPVKTPDVSMLDTSSQSEIINLNKSASDGDENKETKARLLSEGSSLVSTESDDNIVIYDSTPESSQQQSDKTDLVESVVTEPGLNTTIDDFLKDNKTPATTPDTTPAQEKAPATRKSTRKSVRFGPMLSPQEYDKDMPANTPIRRGGMPGRFSVPNPQLSAGRTPLRKSVAVCSGTPVGQLKLDDSLESLGADSLGSLDSANQDSETKAKKERRKTMTPKEVKANIAWADLSLNSEQTKAHVDSPIVTQTPKSMPKATIPFVLEEEESVESPMPTKPRSTPKETASGSKVFGKLSTSAKTPVSAKVRNPAKCRASPPTPVPFFAKGLQKPQSLHTALQKAAGRKAMIQQSQIPKPKTPLKRKSTSATSPAKVAKTPRKSTGKIPKDSSEDSVEEIRQKVLEKKKEILEKRKSIQQKRKSVGPKTWATVASKLTKSPWKAVPAATVVKLPPKTPLRKRALKAMGKTKVVRKNEPKPPLKIGSKRKSTGMLKPVTKPVVKRKSISTKTPAKKALQSKVPVPVPQSPLAAVVNAQTLETLLKAPKGSPQAQLITSAIMKQCEEVLQNSFSEDPTESKEVPLKKLEEVLCDENMEIKKSVDVEELVEIFSDDYQPDSVDQLCKMMDPIVMMQYENDPDFEFGSVNNIMKETESGPEIDPAALRKLFKATKKPKKSECLDAVAMMKLFANPNLIKEKRQSAIIDGEALNSLFDEAVETCDVEQLYKAPDSEGRIVTEKEATTFLRRSSLALRKTLLPGDLSRLFTVENYYTDSDGSEDEEPLHLDETLREFEEEIYENIEEKMEDTNDESVELKENINEKMKEIDEEIEESDEKVGETEEITDETADKAVDVLNEFDNQEPQEACDELQEDNATPTGEDTFDELVVADDSNKENEEPMVIEEEPSEEVPESSKKIENIDTEPDNLVISDGEEKLTDVITDDAEPTVDEEAPLEIEEGVDAEKVEDSESDEESDSEEEMGEEDPELQQQVNTLCAVITPMVRRRWSQNKSYDFGALSTVLTLEDDDQHPEVDPISMRKMFGIPRKMTSANEEMVLDPVSLIKLFLNPDVTKKTSEEELELDPIALQNLFRLPKEPKQEQESDLDPEALINMFHCEVKEEEVTKLYKTLEVESVTKVLDKAKRTSTLPGDICKLFVSENVPNSPGAPNVDEVISKFEEEVKIELSKPTSRRGGRRKKQEPANTENATAIKPTRGRRGRKPAVEKDGALVKAEETVAVTEDIVVEVDQPKRRGRKAAKEIVKPEDISVQVPAIELVEDAPKRRGRGRPAKIEEIVAEPETVEVAEPETIEVAEPPKRRGRGRRAKSEEEVETKEPEPQPITEPEESDLTVEKDTEAQPASRRGRRGKVVEFAAVNVAESAKRGRKVTAENVESEIITETEPATEVVAPALKRRGRPAKVVKEIEAPGPEKPVSTRGRKGKAALVSINDEIETHEIESVSVEKSESISKPTPRRGRRAKSEEEPKPVTPARGRRANSKETPKAEKTPVKGRKAKAVEISELEVTAPTPRRGRRGKAAEIEEEVSEMPAKKARRGKTPTPSEKVESSSPAPNTKRGRSAKEVEPTEKSVGKKRATKGKEQPDSKRNKQDDTEDELATLQKALIALEKEDLNLTMEEAMLDEVIAKSPAAKPATRRGRAGKAAPSPKKPASKKVAAKATPSPKKPAAKKPAAKKPAAKKPAAKKPAAKKPAAKKAAAAKSKKTAEVEESSRLVKKPKLSVIREVNTPAKTPAKRKPAQKKGPVVEKKTPVKKTPAKKATPKKSPAQRVTRSRRR